MYPIRNFMLLQNGAEVWLLVFGLFQKVTLTYATTASAKQIQEEVYRDTTSECVYALLQCFSLVYSFYLDP